MSLMFFARFMNKLIIILFLVRWNIEWVYIYCMCSPGYEIMALECAVSPIQLTLRCGHVNSLTPISASVDVTSGF